MDTALYVLINSIVIAAFIAIMMLLIEFLNVSSRGTLLKILSKQDWKIYPFAALMGILPGCLGAFSMVSFYIHKKVSIGALITTMIATSGDEAFIMLSLMPKTAIILFLILGILAIGAGIVSDKFIFKKKESSRQLECNFEIHQQHEPAAIDFKASLKRLKRPSLLRVVLLGSISLFLIAALVYKAHEGHDHHAHHLAHETAESDCGLHDEQAPSHGGHDLHIHGMEGWMFYTVIALLILTLFIIIVVSDHFLKEHFYDHILKNHLPKIFLWTLGALAFMEIINHYLHLEEIIANNLVIILLIAVLIGIIPESGPHLVFITLFLTGTIPFSILLANSLVQDGHGMVPLLAHSRKDFAAVKTVNAVLGLIVGFLLLSLGF